MTEFPSTSSTCKIYPNVSDVTTSRLGLCEVCAYDTAKYTCPNCEVKSCSLRCSGIHKRELECDGVKNPTKYIPLKKFTNLDLSSDLRLLERITRSVETMKNNRFTKFSKCSYLPNHLFKLRNAALKNGINLKFLPQNFQRRKQNSSYLTKNNGTQSIVWCIEWIFPNANFLKCTSHENLESEKLITLADKYVSGNVEPHLREHLQFYASAGAAGVRLFLKAEEKCGLRYYELDVDVSLGENLKCKTIIEYPIIYVALRHCAEEYPLCESDNDDDKGNVESDKYKPNLMGTQIIEKLVQNSEKEESVYGSLKNLLFVSEHSDVEFSE